MSPFVPSPELVLPQRPKLNAGPEGKSIGPFDGAGISIDVAEPQRLRFALGRMTVEGRSRLSRRSGGEPGGGWNARGYGGGGGRARKGRTRGANGGSRAAMSRVTQ